jgi:hypothetical protein
MNNIAITIINYTRIILQNIHKYSLFQEMVLELTLPSNH